MTEEIQAIEPAPDALPADSSPETEVAVTTPADTGTDKTAEAIQKRIDKLTWEKAERAREADYWRNLALDRQQPEVVKEPEKVKAAPTLAQHEYDEAKYQAALIEWTRAEARSAALEEIKTARQQDHETAKVKTFKTREAEFIAKTPDYQEKVYDPSVPFSQAMVELIAESPDGPALAYHLANNRELAAQIASLPPVLAAREIGRVEARMEKPEPKPKPVSAAPPPPPKIEADESEVTKNPYDDSMTTKEWMKWREKSLKRKA